MNMFAVHHLDTTQVLFDYIQAISDENSGLISMRGSDAFEKCKLNYLANHLEISANETDYYYTEMEKYFSGVKYDKTIHEKSAGEKLVTLGMIKLKSNKFKANKKERVATFLNACRNFLTSLENEDSVGEEYDLKVELYLDSVNKLADELSKTEAKENK
jgi:hypothetical protein